MQGAYSATRCGYPTPTETLNPSSLQVNCGTSAKFAAASSTSRATSCNSVRTLRSRSSWNSSRKGIEGGEAHARRDHPRAHQGSRHPERAGEHYPGGPQGVEAAARRGWEEALGAR